MRYNNLYNIMEDGKQILRFIETGVPNLSKEIMDALNNIVNIIQDLLDCREIINASKEELIV